MTALHNNSHFSDKTTCICTAKGNCHNKTNNSSQREKIIRNGLQYDTTLTTIDVKIYEHCFYSTSDHREKLIEKFSQP